MDRIYVTVRARPLSPEDEKSCPWRICDNSISYHNQPYKFEFDRIFGEECKTREIYEARTREIVAAAVRGFNGTVFAYGQTSSGKTHTMRGSPGEPGVIPLAVRELFNIIQEDMNREFLLRMSYMEIYNEEINDLLAPEHRRLQIHESLERGIFVAGLREEIVASSDQVLDLMEFGETHRHIGETNMNLHSSRSHTIFRMIIESRDRLEEGELESSCDAVRVSVLNLVDLAGSERAAKTGAEGVRLKEGSHINKSLLTLGTVIKKLSEGAESQGGHVPYRDSKLTRILQPALGGNANTAIICNITLAQVHADETKSTLQFASRALRVTNCAHVNEVLTDAALLKRQKREIEELRAKLQTSQSEHFEEEILNLRNTLLKTELERERIALELEEEKRCQAEREKRLEEQELKIKNLSSMVLISNRDEIREHRKRDKRRDTWCPGKLDRETSTDVSPAVNTKNLLINHARPGHVSGPLLPFGELIEESRALTDLSCKKLDGINKSVSEKMLPNSCELLNVTNRRKVPLKKKNVPTDNNVLKELQTAYEELLLKFETQSIINEVQLDCLRKLNESSMDCCCNILNNPARGCDKTTSLREAEAILVIKQLQDEIVELEKDRSISQRNLDNVYEIAKQQNMQARKEYEELRKDLSDAEEEARLARDQLTSEGCIPKSETVDADFITELSLKIQQTLDEFRSLEIGVETSSLVTHELLQSYSSILSLFSDFRSSLSELSVQLHGITKDHDILKRSSQSRITALESEKLLLVNESAKIREQVEGLNADIQKSEKAQADLSEQYDSEKSELVSYIQILEREVSSLSTSSLSREKESLRKDLEKTRTKLKDTESKLKNAIQEKTRIEGEKANAEREIKKLNGQRVLLERDISRQQSRDPMRRESVTGRRRDSFVGMGSNVSEFRRPKGNENNLQQALQEDYKKLEVLAFEMEATIASLEEELALVKQEKEETVARNESLSSELELLSEKWNTFKLDSVMSNEEIIRLRSELEKSDAAHQKYDNQVKVLHKEKEELAVQLTDALLELEEERAIWNSKEKASVEAVKGKANAYDAEIMSLSAEISKVKSEIVSLKEESRVVGQRLKCAEEEAESGEKCSMERTRLRMRLRNTQASLEGFRERYREALEVQDLMDAKFKEASAGLKDRLAAKAIENLNLKKQLASLLHPNILDLQ
ncbi:hypothetical protein V2J09_014448 [Rumex salicifolius]